MSSCDGMGRESMVPSGRMGLACPPLALSNPFLLRMIFMALTFCRWVFVWTIKDWDRAAIQPPWPC